MFSYIRSRLFVNTVRPSCYISSYNPSARPSASILITSTPPHQTRSVHWWHAETNCVVGTFTPLLSPVPAFQACDGAPPFGFDVLTGRSTLEEHFGDVSWTTIGEEESWLDGELSASGSADSVARLSSGTCPWLTWSEEDAKEDDAASVGQTMEISLCIPEVAVEERDAVVVFGVGRPLRRRSTITKKVGAAIRKRRHGNDWEKAAMEGLRQWKKTKFEGREYQPFVLVKIEEEDEEE
ncbi:hypothetical protein DXG03_005628 [Asterophora parasitica]|uniref:Uncharacterized protein n=1 Tax=Asterophora parasitica TaxID=117018 RepID=A0A9P7GEC5_9AGAR|nr:hypothetical protein DXG03_005628 [Asterophora parasitica]